MTEDTRGGDRTDREVTGGLRGEAVLGALGPERRLTR